VVEITCKFFLYLICGTVYILCIKYTRSPFNVRNPLWFLFIANIIIIIIIIILSNKLDESFVLKKKTVYTLCIYVYGCVVVDGGLSRSYTQCIYSTIGCWCESQKVFFSSRQIFPTAFLTLSQFKGLPFLPVVLAFLRNTF